MPTSRESEKLKIEEYEDLTSLEQPPNPPHRPKDKLWLRHVQMAMEVEKRIRDRDEAKDEADIRKPNREIIADVADEFAVSIPTVQRAYSTYILEPSDPNGAARRNWRNRKR